MSQANVTWGAPRIRNELAMVGIEVAVSTVAKYMPRRRKPPSPTWRAFLQNLLVATIRSDILDEDRATRWDDSSGQVTTWPGKDWPRSDRGSPRSSGRRNLAVLARLGLRGRAPAVAMV